MPKKQEQEVDDIVDQAISQKRNVKDILVEMKDTSELMIDLAYSSLLTNSKVIAEEVIELERKMDDLQYEIETMLMLAARTPEDAADLSGIMHVAHAAEDISDAAGDIVDIVFRGVGDHPIYRSFLDETEEQVVRLNIVKNSQLDGKTIGELQILKKTGCYIRAIKRSAEGWVYNPGKENKLLANDILIAIGTESAVDALESMGKKE